MSEKSHLLLVDQQTIDHLLAGVRALQMLTTNGALSLALIEIATRGDEQDMLDSDQLDTLAENLNTGFFEPNQGETLTHFHLQSPELHGYVDEARELYATDEVEIDDQPIFSEADDGVWVGAWVWVPKGGDDDEG